jgi:hypothetical protein
MILLNFSHPLTDEQRAQIEALAGQRIDRWIESPAQFDHDRPFADQVADLADRAGLTPQEWQTEGILVVPPALSWIAVALLAELHGRAGYFVPVVRMRPAPDSLPPRYEVAEILSLQQIRDQARKRR